MRLIDAETLTDIFRHNKKINTNGTDIIAADIDAVIKCVENQPTIQLRENITADQEALEAYDTLREYCRMQRSCENCLLTMGEDEDNVYGNCLMESQGIPMNWKSLDLD